MAIFHRIPKDVLVIAIVILAAGAGFGTGLLAGREGSQAKDQLWIENLPQEEREPAPQAKVPVQAAAAVTAIPAATTGTYVAAKTGSVYYLPTCSGAKRIKEENKVWFQTKADAEAKGYQPAKSCPGL